jgi:nucleotide-binding universal stress UspA family protein
MTTKKIVVGYDRSGSAKDAAAWALDEASRTGASVLFFYAYEWPVRAPAASVIPAPDDETDRAVEDGLKEAVAAAKRTHPTVRTAISIVRDSPAPPLIERSREAGLIVLGSHGHSAVSGLLGSVSVAVSAHARCPVIVARGGCPATAPIVVGVDDSASAHAALAFAVDQAATRGVPLRVIRAWTPETSPWGITPGAVAFDPEYDRGQFDELVAGWRGKYPQVEITAQVLMEHPAAALTAASADAQLLVVGTRGRGALRGMLLGSVGQHLLRHSACTVAVVHDTTT